MENAVDAIKMAFAMLVFVGAVGVVIFAFTKVRVTATAVLDKSDKDTYYQIYDGTGNGKEYSFYRKVGIDTVIANLYSYYGNFYTILFYNGEGKWNDDTHEFIGEIEPIPLYYSEALDIESGTGDNLKLLTQLGRSTLRISDVGQNRRAIYGLDINDELTRQEPWSHSERNDKLFIDALINGRDFIWTNWSRTFAEGFENEVTSKREGNTNIRYLKMRFQYMKYMSPTGNIPLATNTKARFIERVGQYNYDAQFENNDSENEGQGALSGGSYGRYNETNQSDSTITFEDERGNTVGEIANEKITQKKVIQYIYIGQDV